jgi:hypothetical protein
MVKKNFKQTMHSLLIYKKMRLDNSNLRYTIRT